MAVGRLRMNLEFELAILALHGVHGEMNGMTMDMIMRYSRMNDGNMQGARGGW